MGPRVTFRSYFATCPRGAEPALQAELQALGGKGLRPSQGGVRFTGEREVALRACMDLRTALRVLEPVADFELGAAPADAAQALYDGARAVKWPDLLTSDETLAVSASGGLPGLEHTHFVSLKIKDAIVDALRDATGKRPDVELKQPDVAVVAHLAKGRCQLSLDLAGALLSNRGYRVQTVEAPLREALAAAMLLMGEWDLARPLHDPMCGSGTIAIEAALLRARRAVNLERPLACEKWTRTRDSDGPLAERLRAELRDRARKAERDELPKILASDRDADAVQAAQANARAAGVSHLVHVFQADARDVKPVWPPGYLTVNPPYGERLEAGGRKQLKSFFHAFGDAVKRLAGHRVTALAGSDDFESAFGLRPRTRRPLWNGPLECRLLTYEVP